MSTMPDQIISERPRRGLAPAFGMLAAAWGLVAALWYAHLHLTLSHYDAKAHLVVARRVLDSLTPGWIQIGAVWLPLPHVLNLLPVQLDVLYRTGASAVVMSIAAYALLVYASVRLVQGATGSRPAAVVTAVLLLGNPDLLYLQSTPMTEPLLLGLLALGLCLAFEGVERSDARALKLASIALALACLTRYESWPITASATACVALSVWRRGGSPTTAARQAAIVAAVPLAAVLWFFVQSKLTIHKWFVTGGFYVADPRYQGHPWVVTSAVWWGVRALGSATLAYGALAATAAIVALWMRRRDQAALLVPLAWMGAAALPWYAFFEGHPFRVRYMVPSVTAAIVLVGIAVGRLPRRMQALAAVLAAAGVLWEAHPFDPKAPMVVEAQWDVPRTRARRAVTACLPAPGGNDVILASMGSLAHYMQELSHEGFAIRDFLHEGNGDLWAAALEHPSHYVRWVLIDEVGEGGDVLAQRARSDPRFLDGFVRTCEGGGVALFHLAADPARSAR